MDRAKNQTHLFSSERCHLFPFHFCPNILTKVARAIKNAYTIKLDRWIVNAMKESST